MGLLDLFFRTQHSLYHSSHSRGLYHGPGHSILSRRTILLLGDHSSDFPIENCGLPDTTTTTSTTSLRYLGSIDDTLERPAQCVASGHFGDVQFFMRPSSDADPLGEAFTLGVYNNNAAFSDDEYPWQWQWWCVEVSSSGHTSAQESTQTTFALQKSSCSSCPFALFASLWIGPRSHSSIEGYMDPHAVPDIVDKALDRCTPVTLRQSVEPNHHAEHGDGGDVGVTGVQVHAVATNDAGYQASCSALFNVYDPTQRVKLTGSGWIGSKEGAYKLNESLSGRVTFEFDTKYNHQHDTSPTRSFQLLFHVDVNEEDKGIGCDSYFFKFHSTGQDFFSVHDDNEEENGASDGEPEETIRQDVRIHGTGHWNGEPGYSYLILASIFTPATTTSSSSPDQGEGNPSRRTSGTGYIHIRFILYNENADGDDVIILYDNVIPEKLAGGCMAVRSLEE